MSDLSHYLVMVAGPHENAIPQDPNSSIACRRRLTLKLVKKSSPLESEIRSSQAPRQRVLGVLAHKILESDVLRKPDSSAKPQHRLLLRAFRRISVLHRHARQQIRVPTGREFAPEVWIGMRPRFAEFRAKPFLLRS